MLKINDVTGAVLKPPPVGLAFLLSQAGAHAALTFGEQLRALNLKPHDAGILRILGSNPGITQQALSDTLGMFPSRLVGLLDGLETQHLIERRVSPSDRRIYRLHLTKAGRKALTALGRLTAQLEECIFAALDKKERDSLHALLRRIVSQQRITPSVHPAYRQPGESEVVVQPSGERMSETFVASIHKGATKNVTFIVVPPEVVAALGKSRKPPVKVTLNGYTYRSTVASMGGRFMIGLSAENRKAAGLTGDEQLEVSLELDTAPRITEIPGHLEAALTKAKALTAFEQVAPSRRKEFVRQVEEAKTSETRERRIQKIVDSLSK
jgi:DNA-binding MarR family transcriptional regulator